MSSFKRRVKKTTVPSFEPQTTRLANASLSSSFQSSSFEAATTTSANDQLSSSSSSSSTTSSSSTILPSQHVNIISSSQLPGTRPWTSNLIVTSFGLREMDSFLFSPGGGGGGGGQPLQTLVILEEDRLTDDLARALCRYWCAEGVAQRQMVMLPSFLPSVDELLQRIDDNDDDDYNDGRIYIAKEGSSPEELHDFLLSLPKNMHLEKFRSKTASSDIINKRMGNHHRENIAAIEEEDDEDDQNDDNNGSDDYDIDDEKQTPANNDEGLINAWQYRKSIQFSRSGIQDHTQNPGDGTYCHSYNLSQRMWDQYSTSEGSEHDNPLITNTKIVDCYHPFLSPKFTRGKEKSGMLNQLQGMKLFCTLWKHLQREFSTHQNRVIRLFLHRMPVGLGSIALPLLMAKIRKENLPVVVLATIRPWIWLTGTAATRKCNNSSSKLDTLYSLRTTADVALTLDSFSSLRTAPPPEFSLLQGILTVHKCAPMTVAHYTDTISNKRPLADRFGIKRDGRKLTLQLLHLPPEEYSKGGGSGGERSTIVGDTRSGLVGHTTTTSGVSTHGHDHAHRNHPTAGIGCSSLGGEGLSLEF